MDFAIRLYSLLLFSHLIVCIAKVYIKESNLGIRFYGLCVALDGVFIFPFPNDTYFPVHSDIGHSQVQVLRLHERASSAFSHCSKLLNARPEIRVIKGNFWIVCYGLFIALDRLVIFFLLIVKVPQPILKFGILRFKFNRPSDRPLRPLPIVLILLMQNQDCCDKWLSEAQVRQPVYSTQLLFHKPLSENIYSPRHSDKLHSQAQV